MLVNLLLVFLVLISSINLLTRVGILFLELLFVCLEVGLVTGNIIDIGRIFLNLTVDPQDYQGNNHHLCFPPHFQLTVILIVYFSVVYNVNLCFEDF